MYYIRNVYSITFREVYTFINFHNVNETNFSQKFINIASNSKTAPKNVSLVRVYDSITFAIKRLEANICIHIYIYTFNVKLAPKVNWKGNNDIFII